MKEVMIPGTSLPSYGDGDWDDSLQPVDPQLRKRMVSSWTTELMYQTLSRAATALEHFGELQLAEQASSLAGKIEDDFQRHLMPDGVVAGFAIFDDRATAVEFLLHPRETRTGLRCRLIPMTRGILSGIFTPQQAQDHLKLIHEHLLYPDGARLMDRPTQYKGGVERTFRRSESAAFFGREIGLQYVHAHLRYAEAMAMLGRADDLWRALLVVNPIAVTELVPNSRPRQRNCYFSSSDAAFATRYDASRNYDKLRIGEIPTDGGWRIYSSGPGIYTNLVLRHLLGLRRHLKWIEFDPVLPTELDGLICETDYRDRRVRYQFNVSPSRVSATESLQINGKTVAATQASNPYRRGSLRVVREQFDEAINQPLNVVQIS
jgi:cellobiose phosphorylase